jgi:predicted esterase
VIELKKGTLWRIKEATLLLLVICPLFLQTCCGQQLFQVRWKTVNASQPISLSGNSPGLDVAIRTGLAVMPEEGIISGGLVQSELLGLPAAEAEKLQKLFSAYYARLRQSERFSNAPSALPYCLSETKPTEGLATVYAPAKLDKYTKTIVFLHGYGGSLLAYPYFLSGVFSNHIIICPAYGITCGNIPWSYVKESENATAARLKVPINQPMLIGLSAGGFGACRLFVQKPNEFNGLICLGAYVPAETFSKFNSAMSVRFLVGAKEDYVANGTFRWQMDWLKPRVRNLEWKAIPEADHYFLLSQESQSKKILADWETK